MILAVLLLSGIISAEDGLSGFSNTRPAAEGRSVLVKRGEIYHDSQYVYPAGNEEQTNNRFLGLAPKNNRR